LDFSKHNGKTKKEAKVSKSELNDFDDMLAEFAEIDPEILSKPKIPPKKADDDDIEDNDDDENLGDLDKELDENFANGPKTAKKPKEDSKPFLAPISEMKSQLEAT
jgi:hypothetical protein